MPGRAARMTATCAIELTQLVYRSSSSSAALFVARAAASAGRSARPSRARDRAAERELGGLRARARVRVDALQHVQARAVAVAVAVVRPARLARLAEAARREPRRQLVDEARVLDAVLCAELAERRRAPRPDLVIVPVPRHEERRRAVGERERAVAARLAHAEEVLEVALLPEEQLVVRVVPQQLLAALEQRDVARARAVPLAEQRGRARAVRLVQRHRHAERVAAAREDGPRRVAVGAARVREPTLVDERRHAAARRRERARALERREEDGEDERRHGGGCGGAGSSQ